MSLRRGGERGAAAAAPGGAPRWRGAAGARRLACAAAAIRRRACVRPCSSWLRPFRHGVRYRRRSSRTLPCGSFRRRRASRLARRSARQSHLSVASIDLLGMGGHWTIQHATSKIVVRLQSQGAVIYRGVSMHWSMSHASNRDPVRTCELCLQCVSPAPCPSSTPHWSNEFMFQITPCVKTLCSYRATRRPSAAGVSRSARGSWCWAGCPRTRGAARARPACPRRAPRPPSCRMRALRLARTRWPSTGRDAARAG